LNAIICELENEVSEHLHEWQSILGLVLMNALEQDEGFFAIFGKALEVRGYLIGAYIWFVFGCGFNYLVFFCAEKRLTIF
jgi:hypothetical protein